MVHPFYTEGEEGNPLFRCGIPIQPQALYFLQFIEKISGDFLLAAENLFILPEGVSKVTLHAIVNATLPFYRAEGHRYMVSVDGGQAVEVNFNSRLNEDPANVYSIYYPTVAGRVVETALELAVGSAQDGLHTMTISPVEPGTVFQKFVLDFGGYKKSFLFMDESPLKR